MARVLVTGGAGFVGSNLVSKLIQENHEVTIIDDFSNGLSSNVNPAAKLVNADLSENAWLNQLTGQKFDALVHCAAQASNATSFKDPIRDMYANQLSTLHVVRFCEKESIRRLIFTSSMSVYGNAENFPTLSSTLPKPETYYALHKATAESYLKLNPKLDWTIFRLYTTYGAGQNLANQEQGLVKIFLSYILKGEPVKVHGSGDRVRDIIHVSDVVDAIYLSLFNEKSYLKTYNLGTGLTITVKQLIARLYQEMGISEPPNVIYEPADIGDPNKTHADISDAKIDLGWAPKVNPEDGIVLTVSKYKTS
jgi:UDP-glucose 4-epimerase